MRFLPFLYMNTLSLDCSKLSRLISVLCGSDSSPAVPEQALQDVRGPWRAKDGPLDASVFKVAAVDLVGAEPLFDSLLDAVALGEAHGARSRGKTVIHKVHGVLNGGREGDGGGWRGKEIGRQRGETTEPVQMLTSI